MKSQVHFKFLKLAEEQTGEAVIEGYANYNALDSVNERLDPQSMVLDRYKKNPILLFNHNVDYPIGKVTEIEAKPEGVYVKACVSASSDSRVKYIHDLVADGTLKTFSVRFTAKDAIPDPDNQSATLFKNWELQEVSIVSIPMQMDSVFSFTGVKSFHEMKKEILRMKGATVASYLEDKINEALPGTTREELMQRLAEQGNTELGMVSSILAGEVSPVPDNFLAGAAQVLGCDKEKLDELNAVDASKMADGETAPPAEEPPKAADDLDPAVQQCVEEKIPALISEGKSQEEAVAMAISMCSAKGCSTEHMEKFLAFADKTKQALADAPPPNDNAMLGLLQQSVSLMGAVKQAIDELKEVALEISNKMTQVSSKPEVVEVETSVPPPEQEDPLMAKKLEMLEARIKSLGIEL